MEAAAIFTVAPIQRVSAGGIMIMAGNPSMSDEEIEASKGPITLDGLLATAVEALRLLIGRDRARATGTAG